MTGITKAGLPTITISAESLRFSVLLRDYAHTLKYYDKLSIFLVIISLRPYPPF